MIDYYDFIETPYFTNRLLERMSDDEYANLQLHLCEFPDDGDVIKGSGGIRKIRWKGSGRGKRGGVRVIYFLFTQRGFILMLDIYKKNEKADLNKAELDRLKAEVEKWF